MVARTLYRRCAWASAKRRERSSTDGSGSSEPSKLDSAPAAARTTRTASARTWTAKDIAEGGGTNNSSKSMDCNCHSNPPQHCVSNNTLWPVSPPALWGSTSYTRSPPGRGRTSCSTRAPDSAAAPSTWNRHEDESSPGARPGRTRYVSRKVRTWGGHSDWGSGRGAMGTNGAAVVDSLLQARSTTCSLCPAPHPPPTPKHTCTQRITHAHESVMNGQPPCRVTRTGAAQTQGCASDRRPSQRRERRPPLPLHLHLLHLHHPASLPPHQALTQHHHLCAGRLAGPRP